MNWNQRRQQLELLDEPGIPFDAIKKNMEELETINKFLGGHALTLKATRLLTAGLPCFSIAEIGCGGGRNLAEIICDANRNGVTATAIGIDINPECIRFAGSRYPNICFINNNYKEAALPIVPDVLFSALFCHHFNDEDLVAQIQWMYSNCARGFFINDLHRHPLAFYSIRLLTRLLSRSYLVKNDAPLSVQRAFVRKDWEKLFQRAGITNVEIQWAWAFRWRIIVKKKH